LTFLKGFSRRHGTRTANVVRNVSTLKAVLIGRAGERKMQIKHGKGTTEYGPGVDIVLTGNDVASAISAYLVAHDIHINGPRTITVNKELCECGNVYVNPSGYVINEGKKISGRGAAE
jgi:hypothetical protein